MLNACSSDNTASESIKQRSAEDHSQIVQQFMNLYHELNASNCESGIIDKVYRNDILFQDSFHRIDGLDDMKAYFSALYKNLKSSEFVFHDQWVGEGTAMLTWTMIYSHKKLNKGQKISVEGATELRFDEKVYFHKDYFDGGGLLYEHVPVLGSVIKQLKKYMAD